MKKSFLAFASALMIATPAFALVGGPWDGNIPGNTTVVNPSNMKGTYQGTIKGKNIAGILRFTTSSEGSGAVPGYWTDKVTFSDTGDAVIVATYTAGTVAGLATMYIEGTTVVAEVDAVVNLGARQLTGMIDGGTSRATTFPITDGTTHWLVTNNVSINGFFDAKLSKNWAANSFKGKGTLQVRKFDLAGFNADKAAKTINSTIEDYIVSVPMSVKVAGVKTSDVTKLSSVTIPENAEPIIKVQPTPQP